ncbi:MAG: translation initiation factor IF-2 [Candidatus Saccharimonadales bacterium]
MAQKIEIEDQITVGALADKLMMPVSRLITELMKNGVMATVNERVDFDTAEIMVSEMGLDFELVQQPATKPIIARNKDPISEHAVSRPPVVAMMGHVDHGKTSLLDVIRGAHVASHEAGGITQHISAYNIKHDNRSITFLDTPGHEAFAVIREHGARLTDVAIIVVAADDGVKPQTIEAIRFARQAGVKIIVAINKIDKQGADLNRVKQELADQNLLIEAWGGDTVAVEVSAKTGAGIDNLLDIILLVADVEDLRAETDGPASGLIIEAHTEQGRGCVAHALVESGTLKRSDFVVAGSSYGRIRNLESPEGEALISATPSMPVVMTGFKTVPEFGDQFVVVANEKAARMQAGQSANNAKTSSGRMDLSGSDLLHIINRSHQLNAFNVVIKADVQGSLQSVLGSLKALGSDEVAVNIVGSGIGPINENDLQIALGNQTIIYGFNVDTPANVKRLASRDKIIIRQYQIIYELIDDVRAELNKLLVPNIVENTTGRLQVKAVFRTTAAQIICGGEVTKGRLICPAYGRITRGDQALGEVEITNLKRGPQDTKEVEQGEMCGLSFTTTAKIDLQENDRIEVFTRQAVERQL